MRGYSLTGWTLTPHPSRLIRSAHKAQSPLPPGEAVLCRPPPENKLSPPPMTSRIVAPSPLTRGRNSRRRGGGVGMRFPAGRGHATGVAGRAWSASRHYDRPSISGLRFVALRPSRGNPEKALPQKLRVELAAKRGEAPAMFDQRPRRAPDRRPSTRDYPARRKPGARHPSDIFRGQDLEGDDDPGRNPLAGTAKLCPFSLSSSGLTGGPVATSRAVEVANQQCNRRTILRSSLRMLAKKGSQRSAIPRFLALPQPRP